MSFVGLWVVFVGVSLLSIGIIMVILLWVWCMVLVIFLFCWLNGEGLGGGCILFLNYGRKKGEC